MPVQGPVDTLVPRKKHSPQLRAVVHAQPGSNGNQHLQQTGKVIAVDVGTGDTGICPGVSVPEDHFTGSDCLRKRINGFD